MRWLATFGFLIILALSTVGLSGEVQKCCKEAAACPAASKCADKAACCKQAGACEKLTACEQAGTCERSTACDKSSACKTASACGEKTGACCQDRESAGDCAGCDKIEHLEQAARHLKAAGLEAEANHVAEQVHKLRRELLVHKLAELDRLRAEIRELRAAAGPPQQVLLKVQIVEVSLTNLKRLGLNLPGCSGDDSPCAAARCATAECPAGRIGYQVCDTRVATQFVKALSEENILKVLAMPTVVTVSGRPACYSVGGIVENAVGGKVESLSVGTQLDAVVTVVDDKKVRVQVHPRFTALDPAAGKGDAKRAVRKYELKTDCEMELGKTAIFGGPVEERFVVVHDETVRNEVQTLLLVTPEVVMALPPPPTAECPAQTERK